MTSEHEAIPAKLMRRVRRLSVVALVIGVVLLIPATWALIMAPEGATMTMVGRAGYRKHEVGVWALYMPSFLMFVFSWLGTRTDEFAKTRHPRRFVKIWIALMLVLIVFIVPTQFKLIAEAFGWQLPFPFSPRAR